MISKTSARLSILYYKYGKNILWLIPYNISLSEFGTISVIPRRGFVGKLIEYHLKFQIWLRIFFNWFFVVLYLLITDVPTWEYVVLIALGAMNFVFAGFFMLMLVYKDEFILIVNTLLLWNQNLGNLTGFH